LNRNSLKKIIPEMISAEASLPTTKVVCITGIKSSLKYCGSKFQISKKNHKMELIDNEYL